MQIDATQLHEEKAGVLLAVLRDIQTYGLQRLIERRPIGITERGADPVLQQILHRTPFERLITPMKQHDLPPYQRIAADTEIEPAGRAAIGHDRVQLALLQPQPIERPGVNDELDAVARFGKNRAGKSGQSAAVASRL